MINGGYFVPSIYWSQLNKLINLKREQHRFVENSLAVGKTVDE